MEILLVEDHLPTAQSVTCLLRPKENVTHASSCHDALHFLSQKTFDLMIVDLQLPDGSGLQLCQYFQDDQDAPRTLVLSGLSEVETKVRALEAGADDYLTKPFSLLELNARLKALLRRSKNLEKREEQLGKFCFSLTDSVVKKEQKNIHLTPHEKNILTVLLRYRDQVVEKFQLGDGNAVEAQIKNLRKKLEVSRHHPLIETVYGMGYRLNTKYA